MIDSIGFRGIVNRPVAPVVLKWGVNGWNAWRPSVQSRAVRPRRTRPTVVLPVRAFGTEMNG